MGITPPTKGTTSVPGGTSHSPSMTRLLEIQNEKEQQDGRQKENSRDDDDDDLLKLHDAVCEEDLDEIQNLVDEDGGKLVFHQDDDEQNTPLHTVCLRGKLNLKHTFSLNFHCT